MNKFKEYERVYLKYIINQSSEFGKPNTYGKIPRPNRMKTPPNYYGNTGKNAKDYDLYIQDEAQGVFIDKYGNEKGHKAWQGIIGVGNAMWKVCDQILGQRSSMADDNFKDLTELKLLDQCTEFKENMNPGWIINWVWWILLNIIKGTKIYTNDFISDCIPTFKGVKSFFPITTGILLQKAGIDIDNYQLSKKIQAKQDAENAAIEAKRKAEEEQRVARQNMLQRIQELKIEFQRASGKTVQYYGGNDPIEQKYWGYTPDAFKYILRGYYDTAVGMTNLIKLPLPANKDEQRIYDIVVKCNINHQPSILSLNLYKAEQFAYNMNQKITGEEKRTARRNAALKYGLITIADKFK